MQDGERTAKDEGRHDEVASEASGASQSGSGPR